MKKIKIKTAADARLVNAFKEDKDKIINDIYSLIEKAALDDEHKISYSFLNKKDILFYTHVKPIIIYFENNGFNVEYDSVCDVYTLHIRW